MKKLLLFITCLFCVVGCSCSNKKAEDAVKDYLNDYTGLSDNVLKGIDEIVDKEELDINEKNTYKDVIKRQYKDLKYDIENETYDGDSANVTAKITVYDLYKAQKDASDYLDSHPNDFLTNGEYDNTKYLQYKLKQMKDTNETISYTVVFKVNKVDGEWQVEQPSDEVLQKIHGVYKYSENDK